MMAKRVQHVIRLARAYLLYALELLTAGGLGRAGTYFYSIFTS